jgi:PIN domain nuclease of toxin-antitoxin system
VRLLLDTNALLWLLDDSPRLGPHARAAIRSASSLVVVDASLWEITIKVSIGKLRTGPDFASVIRKLGIDRPTVSDRELQILAELPLHHQDPFDRMLIAHALSADLPIVSADAIFASYGVRVIDASV